MLIPVYRYGGQLLVTKEYDLVAFFVVYIAIIQGGQTAGQFFSFAPNIAQAMASANRILQMRTLNESTTTSKKDIQIPVSADIQFKEVSFSYASRDTPVFSDFNLTVQSGQFAALVGPSGCGKSTVASLLERFYEPTQGKILFGQTPIDTMDLSPYRRSLSLVAQESKLFSGTIRENLLLGIEDDTFTDVDDRMIQAAKDAEIHEFINSLPDGYSTQLGANAQTSLSGGQKQRLCIARALLRSPRLLILDEATSSLDSQSEKLIQQAIERLAGKGELTILAIAHRLATIQKADVIFVFGEGAPGQGSRIVERGTHHELLRNRGAYWQMVCYSCSSYGVLLIVRSARLKPWIGRWLFINRLSDLDESCPCSYTLIFNSVINSGPTVCSSPLLYYTTNATHTCPCHPT